MWIYLYWQRHASLYESRSKGHDLALSDPSESLVCVYAIFSTAPLWRSFVSLSINPSFPISKFIEDDSCRSKNTGNRGNLQGEGRGRILKAGKRQDLCIVALTYMEFVTLKGMGIWVSNIPIAPRSGYNQFR